MEELEDEEMADDPRTVEHTRKENNSLPCERVENSVPDQCRGAWLLLPVARLRPPACVSVLSRLSLVLSLGFWSANPRTGLLNLFYGHRPQERPFPGYRRTSLVMIQQKVRVTLGILCFHSVLVFFPSASLKQMTIVEALGH